MSSLSRRHNAITLQQAVHEAPTLAHLQALAQESQARMAVIAPLLPPALRPVVKPGVPEGDTWRLLVPHNAAAAKLRQLLPNLQRALTQAGHAVPSLQIKVVSGL